MVVVKDLRLMIMMLSTCVLFCMSLAIGELCSLRWRFRVAERMNGELVDPREQTWKDTLEIYFLGSWDLTASNVLCLGC